jgi:hypothetical protein
LCMAVAFSSPPAWRTEACYCEETSIVVDDVVNEASERASFPLGSLISIARHCFGSSQSSIDLCFQSFGKTRCYCCCGCWPLTRTWIHCEMCCFNGSSASLPLMDCCSDTLSFSALNIVSNCIPTYCSSCGCKGKGCYSTQIVTLASS